jgi:acetyl-CoA carboxylase carboxyl transferase subunit alpha
MRITAESLNGFGLVDEVLPEPLGAAHRDPAATADVIRNALLKHLTDVDQLDIDQLLAQRQRRLAGFGQFKEG